MQAVVIGQRGTHCENSDIGTVNHIDQGYGCHWGVTDVMFRGWTKLRFFETH